jgi:hypothetical protein
MNSISSGPSTHPDGAIEAAFGAPHSSSDPRQTIRNSRRPRHMRPNRKPSRTTLRGLPIADLILLTSLGGPGASSSRPAMQASFRTPRMASGRTSARGRSLGQRVSIPDYWHTTPENGARVGTDPDFPDCEPGERPEDNHNLVSVLEPTSCIVDSIAGENFMSARALRDRLPPGVVTNCLF